MNAILNPDPIGLVKMDSYLKRKPIHCPSFDNLTKAGQFDRVQAL